MLKKHIHKVLIVLLTSILLFVSYKTIIDESNYQYDLKNIQLLKNEIEEIKITNKNKISDDSVTVFRQKNRELIDDKDEVFDNCLKKLKLTDYNEGFLKLMAGTSMHDVKSIFNQESYYIGSSYILEYEIKSSIEYAIDNDKLTKADYYFQLFRTPINKYLRSPEAIQYFYDVTKEEIFDNLSLDFYYDYGIYFINSLVKSYMFFNEIDADNYHYQQLRDIIENQFFANWDNRKVESTIHDNPLRGITELNYEYPADLSKYDKEWFVYWVNTFWTRRKSEKNTEIVYNILTDVQNRYNKSTVFDSDGKIYVYNTTDEHKFEILELSTGDEVVYRFQENDWYYIEYNGVEGYVHTSKLEL